MSAFLTLANNFDRAIKFGTASLSSSEYELYLIQDFIIEVEMNGLSGYFYNRLVNKSQISASIDAMRKHGLTRLAELLHEAYTLFDRYVDSDAFPQWSGVLEHCDPHKRLDVLEKEVYGLDDYGLGTSLIK